MNKILIITVCIMAGIGTLYAQGDITPRKSIHVMGMSFSVSSRLHLAAQRREHGFSTPLTELFQQHCRQNIVRTHLFISTEP